VRVLNAKTATPREKAAAVYCGRPGPYGNPFVIPRDGNRDEVCDRFDLWVRQPAQKDLRNRARREMKGRDLLCFCAPLRCHCDTWKVIASEEEES
jgi:hypothetical protein